MFKRLLTRLGTWLHEPEAGDRVVLIADVEFDGGVLRKGATGVVVMTCWATAPDLPIGTVLMDRYHPMLPLGGNRLHVGPRRSPRYPATWSDFKKLTRS